MCLTVCHKQKLQKSDIENGLDIIAALAEQTGFLKSNGEARRALKGKFYFSK